MKEYLKRNKRNILSGMALGGIGINAYSWFKAGYMCKPIMDGMQEEMDLVEDGDKSAERAVVFDAAKKIIPKVLPATISSIATGGAIVLANNEAAKEIAVLSTCYTFAKTNLSDTKNKMKEMFGVKKERDVRDKVVNDRFQNGVMPPPDMNPGPGDSICKDEYSGRYFYSNAAKIQHAIDKISMSLIGETWVSLNDFYDLIGLDNIKMGDDFGWGPEDCNFSSIPITFTACLDDRSRPVLVVEFDVRPLMRYRY